VEAALGDGLEEAVVLLVEEGVGSEVVGLGLPVAGGVLVLPAVRLLGDQRLAVAVGTLAAVHLFHALIFKYSTPPANQTQILKPPWEVPLIPLS
jgi:hypothetical protein